MYNCVHCICIHCIVLILILIVQDPLLYVNHFNVTVESSLKIEDNYSLLLASLAL